MSITTKLRGLFRLPKLHPEVVVVTLLLGVAGWAVLEELARWLSLP